jgi:hypothetical protein
MTLNFVMQNDVTHESYPWMTSVASDLYLRTQQGSTRPGCPNIYKTTNLTPSRDELNMIAKQS